ncbi:MAG: hypothetical protein LBK75_00960 [Oscillospiraceae bacterium]|nr:hypothetical protein [Oscillospiraceae bacterium]
MEALTPKGFKLLSDEEMLAVDGGGIITGILGGLVAAVGVGLQVVSVVVSGLTTVAGVLLGLFGIV